MQTQPEFPLILADPAPDLLADLLTLLRSRRTWLTASEILEAMGQPVTETGRRTIRKLAEQSDGQILSGQHGYRHLSHATAEEITHAANWLESQAFLMSSRAKRIRARAHLNLNPKPYLQ
jgi:vacuolar-type H+-ATPase subunit C/Vma6